MSIPLTQELIARLAAQGISTLHQPGMRFPWNTTLEPPCSLKWMTAEYALELGAFSYAVSGYYFGCRIGRYCSFGEQVQFGRHGHPMHWASTSPFFYENYKDVLNLPLPEGVSLAPREDFRRSTPHVQMKLGEIGSDVWIGHGAFILPGVKIGHGACIAAMSVVTRDVPPYAIVAGHPAQVMRYRFDEAVIERLLQLRWWEFAPWDLKGATVDQLPAFLDFVAELRERGVPEYRPEKIDLKRFSGMQA